MSEYEGKNVLIIGVLGMLGQALQKQLIEKGYLVTGWDKDEIDIIDEKTLREKITVLKPDILINCAAYNNVEKAETEDKEIAFKVNGDGVGYLANICKDFDIVFVHYSSSYVFDGLNVGGYNEDATPNPINVYGESKLLGEMKILEILNLKYYLVRTSNLFGAPAISPNAKKSFVDIMLKLGKEKESLDLVDEEVTSPTYVVDLAKATVDLLESGTGWGIYHRSNNGSCTWYGWANKIFELAKINIKQNPVSSDKFPRPSKHPNFAVLNSTKLPVLRNWQEALEEYLNTLNS